MKFRSFSWRDVPQFATALIVLSSFVCGSASGHGNRDLPPPAEQSAIGPAFLSTNIASGALDTEKLLYSFGKPTDGGYPNAALIAVNGTLYGTTFGGGISGYCGPSGCGTVFKVTTAGQETVLTRFNASDGANPIAGLVAVGGLFYGTTSFNISGTGTVFEVSPSGSERVIHNFRNDPDGASPAANLINVGGVLYGTTSYGGYPPGSGDGTVFKISPSGSGNELIVYAFGFPPDGLFPESSLIDVDGSFYGTTYGGGASSCTQGQCGTVFKVSADGKERILHSFAGGSDGSNPAAALINVGGDLYGTTAYGGATPCTTQSGTGCGTVFKITTGGKESVIYRFAGGPDGEYSFAPLVYVAGALYGTTSYSGGQSGCGIGSECGTVFKITARGKESVIHRFVGYPTDGGYPLAGLVQVGSKLYGTTVRGGANDTGTVYSIRL